ncbi:MAG: hypothetical protein ABJB47_03400 [Actinomycetota bacterium]
MAGQRGRTALDHQLLRGYLRELNVALRGVPVTWISQVRFSKGESGFTNQLFLRVRVGWFTRTETIKLNTDWFLTGPSHGRCS